MNEWDNYRTSPMVGKLSPRMVNTAITGEGFKGRPGHLLMASPSSGAFSPLPGYLLVPPCLWPLAVCPSIRCNIS